MSALQKVQDHDELARDPHSKAVLVSGDAVAAYRKRRASERAKDDIIHQLMKRLSLLEERVATLESRSV